MKHTVNLATGNIKKTLVTFAVPCIISMLINSVYNIVDQIFIGQGVGYLGNGATNVIFPLVVIFTGLALLLGNGAASFLSLNLGEKDVSEAKRGTGFSITMLILLSLVFTILSYLFLPQLIQAFGCTPKVFPYALAYGKVIVLGLPFMMISTGLSGIIRADGSPTFSMISVVIGVIINLILDPIFIFVFHWDMEGAALATIIGQFVSCLVTLTYLWKFKSFKLQKNDFKPTPLIFKIVGYGMSSFITQVNIVVVMIVMNHCLTTYGAQSIYGADIPLSVFGVVMKVSQIFIALIVGLALGAQPLAGFNYGAKHLDRVKETFHITIYSAFVIGLICSIIFLIFPKPIIGLFGSGNEVYETFAISCFRIYLLATLLNAFQITTSILLQSLGKVTTSIVLSVSRQILLFVPIVLLLSSKEGINGTLWAAPTADTLAFIIAVIIFIYEYKTLEKSRVKHNL